MSLVYRQNPPHTMDVFMDMESEVRSYCRSFPAVFVKSKGYRIWDSEGREYLDFFAGAGALNYGHNNTRIKEKLLDYIMNDGITHSLDMATGAKERFLLKLRDVILRPRKLDYKVMFPGPTGTNAVESALKLARKVTGRQNVIGFTNGFHGMTLGSLSITGNQFKRHGAGVPLNYGISVPYCGYMGEDLDTTEYLDRLLTDDGSGVSLPAAVIVETVQGEGGLNAASMDWLVRLSKVCAKHDVLLIVDDIQAGCGRTGTFFSFEPAGIVPDIVCLSKSIGGYGLPLSLTLFKPELDVWQPGEHNGTFRGNNLAFVAAEEALSYWENDKFAQGVKRKEERIRSFLQGLVMQYPKLQAVHRGRGLMQGIAIDIPGAAEAICEQAFRRGVIMETSGPNSEVMKLLPPLTMDDEGLEQGLLIIESCVAEYVKSVLKA